MSERRILQILVVTMALVAASCGGASSPDSSTAPLGGSSTTLSPPATTALPTTAAPLVTTTASGTPIEVFFSIGDGTDCSEVGGFEREVSGSEDPIGGAFEQLVAGPTAGEVADGAGSFFSEATADEVMSVTLDGGALTVDFADFRADLSNASTSCGSASFLASLNATAFQFEDVERVRYSILGSCNVFYNWLQRDCRDQTRAGSVSVDLDIYARASGSGCTPGTQQLPDGEWFGYVASASPDEVELDLACWFSGSAAADAAAEDGSESPPPNDYYIRNESDQLRTVPVAVGTKVAQLTPTGGPDSTIVDYGTWAAEWSGREYQPSMWVTIAGDEIVSIVEQYVP